MTSRRDDFDELFDLRFDENPGSATVTVKRKDGRWLKGFWGGDWFGSETQIVVHVPSKTAANIRTSGGSIDASRKRSEKLAEFAVLDTDAWRVEFWRLPYDCAATEAKAAVFGYRINPWLERLYTLRRRLGAILGTRSRSRRALYGRGV